MLNTNLSRAIGLAVFAVGATVVASVILRNKALEKTLEDITRLQVTPLSVASSYDNGACSISMVYSTLNGADRPFTVANIYFDSNKSHNSRQECSTATALIQSEIADGDNDPIFLEGKYHANMSFNQSSSLEPYFEVKALSVNGYRLEF